MSTASKVYLDHRTAQLWGVNKNILKDSAKLIKATLKVTRDLNLTIVNQYLHKFEPHGLSLVLIIAESHLAIHTWPEYNYMHIDVVSCSKKADLSSLDQVLREHLKPEKLFCQKIQYH